MINRSESTAATWLKYPVLMLTTFTVATLFARPEVHTMAKFMPAQFVATGVGTIDTPAQEIAVVSVQEQAKAASAQIPTMNVAISADTVLRPALATLADLTPKSPSRYMQYEGDRLYWIITPKTSFDDLAIMKQEFARHGYRMQVQELKYDPLDSYITEIKITVIRPTAGISDFEETGVAGKPIRSHGGFNGLNTLKTVAVVSSYPFGEDFPQGLLQIVRDDEQSVATFIHTHRMKYLIAASEELSHKYGPGTTAISNVSGLLARPYLVSKYGIRLNTDSTLDITDSSLPLFINNEPVTNTVLKRIPIKNFSTLMISETYSQNGQPGAARALLFYTKEP